MPKSKKKHRPQGYGAHNVPHWKLALRAAERQLGEPIPGLPPSGTYDPAIAAQQRAAARGLIDLIRSTHRENVQGRQDFRTTKRDLALRETRGLEDYRTKLQRGLLTVRQKRRDTALDLTRGEQDFTTKLGTLVRHYTQQGQGQAQAANAAGVADAGTLAASAAARSQNFTASRQPLDTAIGRLRQDTRTNLSRLGTQAGQLHRDVRRGRTRLGQDVEHDTMLAHRDLHRTLRANRTTLQQAIREEQIGQSTAAQEAVYNARASNPGAFTRKGTRRKGKPLAY